MDLTVDEDGYNSSTGSIDEDAELELSCALHDLALRVKNFEENMQGRFKHDLSDEEEEITEDFDHIEEPSEKHYGRQRMDSDSASPKRKSSRRRKSNEFKAKTQHDDDEDEYYPLDSDEEDLPEVKSEEKDDWDSQEEKEELYELKHNIAKLLASMQEEAKALDDNQTDCKTAG
ncbi:hypothetical protein DVH05_020422 [Phytophthora capsici]|nr:hypothetical protein DVH05_020422 [Phytophthora capsici]